MYNPQFLYQLWRGMKGQLQKTIEASALACLPCRFFRDHDPDIYYCDFQQEEFPGLCEKYQQRPGLADPRTEWVVPDDL